MNKGSFFSFEQSSKVPPVEEQPKPTILPEINFDLIEGKTTENFLNEFNAIKDDKVRDQYLRILTARVRMNPGKIYNSLSELPFPPPFGKREAEPILSLNVPGLGPIQLTRKAFDAYNVLPSAERKAFVLGLARVYKHDPHAIITSVEEVVADKAMDDPSTVLASERVATTMQRAVSPLAVAQAMRAPVPERSKLAADDEPTIAMSPKSAGIEVADEEPTRSLHDELVRAAAQNSELSRALNRARTRHAPPTPPAAPFVRKQSGLPMRSAGQKQP